MNRLTIRIWITAALMTGGWLVTSWARSEYALEVRPLSHSLNTFPLELDGYRGAETPLDDDVRKILNADEVVNRYYVRPDGSTMVMHASAWIRPEAFKSVAPHVPKVCYVNGGWKILDERTVQFSTPIGKLPLIILFLERDAEHCVVAFWYQLGKSTYTTAVEARQIHRELWGKRQWPATIKVLLQTPAPDIDSALPRIEQFAASVFKWTYEL